MAENESDPWVVHVIGPDDVLLATGMLDAIRQAHAINEEAVGPEGYYGRATEDREHMTLAWAVPSRESWLGGVVVTVSNTEKATQYVIVLPNGQRSGPYPMPKEGEEVVWTFPAHMLERNIHMSAVGGTE